MKRAYDFSNYHTLAEVKAAVLDALGNVTIVENKTCAWMLFMADGFTGEVGTRLVFAQDIELWNGELLRHEKARVRIFEHYVDSNSDNYLYSFSVNID